MAGAKNLIGGVGDAGLVGAVLDVEEAVDGRGKEGKEGSGDGLDDDGATAALEAVEGEDDELPERGLEEEGDDDNHLAQDQGKEQLDHGFLLIRFGFPKSQSKRKQATIPSVRCTSIIVFLWMN